MANRKRAKSKNQTVNQRTVIVHNHPTFTTHYNLVPGMLLVVLLTIWGMPLILAMVTSLVFGLAFAARRVV